MVLGRHFSGRARSFICCEITDRQKEKKMYNLKFHFLLDASERRAHLVTGKHTSTMTYKSINNDAHSKAKGPADSLTDLNPSASKPILFRLIPLLIY